MLLISASCLQAQNLRSLVNEGVDLYKEGNFADSEINFKKSLEKSPENFEANFNLGDAYYKQEKYDEAMESYQSALALSKNDNDKAKVYHNIGNSLLKSDKIKESIEAYKNSLKLNPNDAETKYNLSYALSLLNNPENQKQDQNKDQQNDKDDKKDNEQQDKNQDQQNDQNKNDQQQDQNKPDQNQESQQDNLKQPDPNQISKAEAERILEALKNNEKELQNKLRKKTGVPIKTDKDW
jgi:Ca-activated chloride channel homolog